MLAVSAGALATAVAAHAMFPPLALVSVGLSSYAATPVFADAVSGLVGERRIKASTVDTVFIVGAMAGGYCTAMALANGVYFLGRKLLQRTEQRTRLRLDDLFGASLLVAGTVAVRIEQAGVDTVAAGIAEILRNTADFRSSLEHGATRLADALAVPTLALGATTLWLVSPVAALAVTGCNCTEVLRIVTPLSTLSHLRRAAHSQVLL